MHETSESGGLDLALVIRSLGDSESSILVDHASILMHAGSTKEKLAMATEMAKTEEPNIDDWLFEKGLEDQSRVSDIKQSLAEQISAALAEEGVSKAELRYSGTGRLCLWQLPVLPGTWARTVRATALQRPFDVSPCCLVDFKKATGF